MNFFRLVHLKNTISTHQDNLLSKAQSSSKKDQPESINYYGRNITISSSSAVGSNSTSSSSSSNFIHYLFMGGKNSSTALCEAPPPLPPPPLPGTSSSSTQQMEPPPLPSSSQEDTIAAVAASVTAAPIFPNPGLYEHIAVDCKRILSLDTHDGFRVDINKQLSPYMAVVHNFWLGTNMLGEGRNKSYSFVTQVADEQGFLMARYDPSRNSIDGRVHRAALGGLATLKAQFVTSPAPSDDEQQQQQSNDQLLTEVDIVGDTWTANFKYGSMGGANVFGCNYFQAITKNWSVGGEGMYLAANRALLSNYAVKYNGMVEAAAADVTAASGTSTADEATKNSTTSIADAAAGIQSYSMVAQYNTAQQMLSLNYKRVITPKRVTVAAQLECSPMTLESHVLLGAEFQLTRSKIGVVVDGEGKIQSVVEAKLGIAPGSPTLSFTAEVDHLKDQMRFGYGLNIGG